MLAPATAPAQAGATSIEADEAVTWGEIFPRAMTSGARILVARKADVPVDCAPSAILGYPL